MPTTYTPRHTRLLHPPRMRLTERDVAVVLAVYAYRVLRRDQIQRMFFTGKNTANERLKRLYHHGYLARRWLPVEYGQGSSQALYLLAERGAQLVAATLGVDRAAIDWKEAHNRVSSPFLEHLLLTNEIRSPIPSRRAASCCVSPSPYTSTTARRARHGSRPSGPARRRPRPATPPSAT